MSKNSIEVYEVIVQIEDTEVLAESASRDLAGSCMIDQALVCQCRTRSQACEVVVLYIVDREGGTKLKEDLVGENAPAARTASVSPAHSACTDRRSS